MWWIYALLFFLALLFSASAVYAFFWASKTGQMRDFDAQAHSIFDATEPEGVQSDFFPRQRGARRRRPARPLPPAFPASRNEP